MAGQYIYPKLLFEFGRGKSLSFIFKRSLIASLLIMVIMIVSGPFILFLLNYVINHWLPLYRDSIPLMTIFYIGAVFASSNLVDVIISAANRPSLLLYQNVLILVIAYIIFSVFSSSKPIIWYAYIVLVIQVIKLVSSILINYIIVRINKNDQGCDSYITWLLISIIS